MKDTEPYAVDRSEMFVSLMLVPALCWPIWGAVVVGVACVVAGCVFDTRILVVGLMMCLAVAPLLTAFAYFSYTLAPDMAANVIPHTLERCPDGFLLRIWCHGDDEEDDGQEWRESGSMRLLDADIVKRKSTLRYDILFFRNSPLRMLYLPKYMEIS